MNHAIKVVRHETEATLPSPGPGRLYANGASRGCPDEEIIATLLCSMLHDDENTAEATRECREIHVPPPGYELASCSFPLLSPDPQCVIKRTAFLRRWKGVNTSRSDTVLSEPCGPPAQFQRCSD